MAVEALQAMDAAAAIDVIVGWVGQASQGRARREALLAADVEMPADPEGRLD